MAVERGTSPEQKEKYLGLTTLEVARGIVGDNKRIGRVNLRWYYYVPNTVPEISRTSSWDRKDFLDVGKLGGEIEKLGSGWNIAFDSKCEDAEGNFLYLPMMDLALDKSPENLQRTQQRLRDIIKPDFGGGVILETNASYHFLGDSLISHDDWLRFLGASLLTGIINVSPDGKSNHESVADNRYIGHSLLRGTTGLRITTNGTKTFIPRAIAII